MNDPKPGTGGTLRTILVVVGGTGAVQAMTLVTGIVSARLLGVEGRGQLAMVAAVSILAARLTLGASLPVAISQLLASHGLTARDGLRPFVRGWALLSLLPGLLTAAALLWYFRDESDPVRIGLAVLVALMTVQTIAAGLLAGAIQGELAGAGKVVLGAVLLQAPTFVLIVVAGATGWADTAVRMAAVMVVAGVLGCLLTVRLLRPATGDGPPLATEEVRRVSRQNYLNSVGALNRIGIDRSLVGAWLGTAQLGLYAVGTAFANVSSIVGTSVASLLLPRLSAADADPEQQRRLIRGWLTATGVLLLLIVGVLELLVEPVIRIAFGTAFLPALTVARWMLLADGFFGFRRLLISVLQARGRGAVASWIELTLTGVLVAGIGAAALADSLDLVGVTLAVVGALSCVALALAIRLGPTRPTRPQHSKRSSPEPR